MHLKNMLDVKTGAVGEAIIMQIVRNMIVTANQELGSPKKKRLMNTCESKGTAHDRSHDTS